MGAPVRPFRGQPQFVFRSCSVQISDGVHSGPETVVWGQGFVNHSKEESVREKLIANEYEFTENGEIYQEVKS